MPRLFATSRRVNIPYEENWIDPDTGRQAIAHLGRRDGKGRIRCKIERRCRKPRLAGFERALVVRPAVDAVVVDGDILAAEIADGEMREIGADVAAGRIHDDLAHRIDSAAAEYRFDARGFDEILGCRVTEDA